MASARRVAMVTGGSRGIGFGVAQALARDGLDLVICGRKPAADDAVTALRQAGGEVLYVRADISSADDRAALVAAAWDRFGRLDVLVNNAGVAPDVRADIMDAGTDSFERLMRINVEGPFFLTQAVARRMAAAREADPDFAGTIVFVTSVSATVVSTNRGDYCMSKAALAMAARLWAVRLAEFDIPVYEVRPGIIRTDMTAGVTEKYDRLFAEGITLQRRWGEPADVGRVVASLARGDMAYGTGQVIQVDGGLTVQTL